MLKKTLSFAAMAVMSMMLSCQDNLQSPGDSRLGELKAKVRAAGYSTEGMHAYRDGYLVEGDILMSEESIHNLDAGSDENAKTNHYVTNNVISSGVFKVAFESGFDSQTRTLLASGINRFNVLGLNVGFDTTPPDVIDAIWVRPFFDQFTTILAFVPLDANGNFTKTVFVNTFFFNDNTNRADIQSVIAHEFGHVIGFRHTDYFNTCAGAESGSNANHVPNTPTGTSNESWMTACSNDQDRPFTAQDVEALTRVCGTPKVTPGIQLINGPYSYNGYSFAYGDVTGDGKADAVAFNTSLERAIVWVNNGTGTAFASGAQWIDGPWDYNGYEFSLADVTGDGKADMIGFSPAEERAIVWVSNGAGFNSGAQWVNGPYIYNGYKSTVADVNGDGKADLIGFSASEERAIVWLSTGSSFSSGAQWIDGPFAYSGYTFSSSDVNGDGKSDFVGINAATERVIVWKSTGSAFSSGAQWIDGPHSYSTYIFKTADLDGDGKGDVVGFDPSVERAVVWLSTGTAFSTGRQWLGGPYVYGGYSFGVGKFNADAKADMIAVSPSDERFILWKTN